MKWAIMGPLFEEIKIGISHCTMYKNLKRLEKKSTKKRFSILVHTILKSGDHADFKNTLFV